MNDDLTAPVAALGDLVTIWAHPDDESYLAAGLMSVASHLGAHVTCITATRGDLAPTEAERIRIGRVRHAELAAALDVLGVSDRVELGCRDGECAASDGKRAIDAIAAVIADRRPDTVVTFGPDGLTGHPDHIAVSGWTTEALRRSGCSARLLHTAITQEVFDGNADINDRFPVFEPGAPTMHTPDQIVVELSIKGRWLDAKLRALQCHCSQTAGLIEVLGYERYRRWVRPELFVDAPR